MSPNHQPSTVVVSLALACLLCSLAVVAIPAGAQSTSTSTATSIVVTNATQTPTTPTAGDTFEVRATIRNQAGASGPFTVNDVVVEVPGRGPDGYTRARDLGVLTPGTSIDVGLPATVTEPGWHQLRVLVYGQTSTGRAVRVTYPVTVRVVERQRPQLDVVFDDGVVGVESAVNVTVANGLAESIRSVRVELDGSDVQVDRPSRVQSTLAGERETDYTFNVTPERVGTGQLTARLTYTDATGDQRTVTDSFDYRVDPLERDVRLDVAAVRGDPPGVEVTVVNLGNAPLEDVSITGESGQASVSTALVDRVAPRASETVRLDVGNLAAVGESTTVRADYEVGNEGYETARTVDGVFVPGRVDLTGVDVESIGDGAVRITGTASNVGTTRVQAVTVRVRSTEAVAPSNPGKEYFVGAIDASDFSSFTVNARVGGENETTIPLEVTYLVDGDERTRTVEATYDPPVEAERSGGSGVPFVGVAVLVVAVAGGVFVWRRRRAA